MKKNQFKWGMFVVGQVEGAPQFVVDVSHLELAILDLQRDTWNAAIKKAAEVARLAVDEQRSKKFVFVGKPRELWAVDLITLALEKEYGNVGGDSPPVPGAPLRKVGVVEQPALVKDEGGAVIRGENLEALAGYGRQEVSSEALDNLSKLSEDQGRTGNFGPPNILPTRRHPATHT